MIRITIDEREIRAVEGQTVLEAAREAGIYVPTLCSSPDLKPYGGCRLCVVEIDRMRGLPTACTTPVAEGMTVRTDTPAVRDARLAVLDLILAEHPLDCLTCVKNQRCELQQVTARLGFTDRQLPRRSRVQAIDDSNPFFRLDRNYCILCARCTRACDEISGNNAIEITGRGYDSRVGTASDRPITETNCRSCGECVVRCPVAALAPKLDVLADNEQATICPYCGVGCGLILKTRGARIVSISGDSSNPVSKGRLCVKGRYGVTGFVHHPDRLTEPQVRKNGVFMPVPWDEALETVCSRLAQYKPSEVAVISSAKATNEENYLIQKLARAVLETNSVDHCARLCHAPTVAGLAAAFGSGAMTNSIGDLKNAACFFIIGANTSESHPIIGFDLKQAIKNGARLIVANPVPVPLASRADIYLQHTPGSDVMLLSAMCKVIITEDLLDHTFIQERTEGFVELAASLADFSLDQAAETCGVPLADIKAAARLYASSQPSAILYAMGITQHSHGTDNVLAVANLAMLTGNIGKPGGGVNPLRGQNNVQGACDMGALPDVYPGYQKVSDAATRRKFESAWGVKLPYRRGLTVPEILDSIDRGKIKALYIVGENLTLSEPDSGRVRRTLSKLEFMAVQDIFRTETAELGHVILAAASFAEKEGTFTNTERRVQRLRQAIQPAGESKPDWWITAELGKRLGGKGFDYSGPEQIFSEMHALTPSYGGITYQRLKNVGLQWPCPDEGHPGTPILHTKQFVRGRGIFKPVGYLPPAEQLDADFPFILTTGRSPYHFHTGTMTRRVTGLKTLQPREILEIASLDATSLCISPGDVVRVTSRRGAVTAEARINRRLKPGVVFMSFHFPETNTNIITNPTSDPLSGTPELKVAAVRLEKV
ncbi:formate dehydrogenase subunit alpha [Dehalogenimonas sp. 4OHTPN]|uniref:Formate dehydrogenase subunit alpha n=1 Tax=Dehalogenimonas sp. 4OHTPN TaxID=3166643 RepID=A0AAU8GEL4_9CHLR